MRFGVQLIDGAPPTDVVAAHRQIIDRLVARGGRAVLRSGNLLTGALFVAFDFFPDAPATTIDWSQNPPQIPTQPGQMEAIESNVASIIKKIDAMPLEQIGVDLKKAIAELNRTLMSAQGTLGTADRLIAPNSTLATGLDSTMNELNRAARSLRVLMDYLERHPEALLRGKSEGKK
jgi:paraquat-inducible protein B